MANIVVIIGSPRKKGNSTKLADAFIRGAEASGNQVTRFHAGSIKVNGCLGCDSCLKHEGQCIQKDDMQKIYDAMYQADTLVLATPVYWFGMTAQLKTVIDRFYTCMARPFAVKSSALLAVYGGDDETELGSTVAHYKDIVWAMKWKHSGAVIVSGVNQTDITGNPALQKAEEFGRSFS